MSVREGYNMIEELAGKGDSGDCQGREAVGTVREGYSVIDGLAGKGESGDCQGGLRRD